MLQEFNFELEHESGKHNDLPDFLSRNPDELSSEENVNHSVEHISVPQIPKGENQSEVVLLHITSPYQMIENKHL